MLKAASVVLATIALVAASCVGMTPAHADHTWALGHWYHTGANYSAPPVNDRVWLVRGGVQLTAEAADYWRYDVAGQAINPYVSASAGGAFNCNREAWTIVVCLADLGGVQGDGSYTIGSANVYAFDGEGHIQDCVIRVNSAVLMSTDILRRAIRHEMGHCLGLGHTATFGLMRPYPESIYANQHDTDALLAMYSHHQH